MVEILDLSIWDKMAETHTETEIAAAKRNSCRERHNKLSDPSRDPKHEKILIIER
jgi:hypothetical protein